MTAKLLMLAALAAAPTHHARPDCHLIHHVRVTHHAYGTTRDSWWGPGRVCSRVVRRRGV